MRRLLSSMVDFVPCDRELQRAHFKVQWFLLGDFDFIVKGPNASPNSPV